MNTLFKKLLPLWVMIFSAIIAMSGSPVSGFQNIKELAVVASGPVQRMAGVAAPASEPRYDQIIKFNPKESPGLTQMTDARGDASGPAPVIMAKITRLATRASGAGDSIISIESTRALNYTAFKLLNPLRLVLDFTQMVQGDLTDRIQVDQGVVDSIRPLYFSEAKVLRLEISLNRPANYDIRPAGGNNIEVHLQAAASQMAQTAPPVPAPDFPPSAPIGVRMDSEPRSDDYMDNQVARSQEVAEGKEKLATEEEEVDTCKHLLSGEKEKISLDFQEADLRNIFRIFSEVSGFNLILARGVEGGVTMRLLDVPWNQAFSTILENNNLWRLCMGENIIRIASRATLANEEAERRDQAKRRMEAIRAEELARELVTEVVQINYADLVELQKNLNGLVSDPDRAIVAIDLRTNQVVLTDIKPHVEEMKALVKVLDVPTDQVMIEARIVEVNKNFAENLGIKWGLSSTDVVLGDRTDVALNQGIADPTLFDPFIVDLAPSVGTALSATPAGAFNLLVGGLAGDLRLDIQLEALEEQGRARILASPKVTTLDNTEAVIKAGQKIPFQTITNTLLVRTEFVDAELMLKVTPHITKDGFVYMIIDATKNAADFSRANEFLPPVITTKEAHTEVLVADGDTTVLGGIYESEENELKEAVPLFSKIPLLGLLFQSNAVRDIVNELLIFVTPTVVKNRS